jgi:hypothetical protein
MSNQQTSIFVLPSGWVIVGNPTRNTDGTITVTNCKNVHRWGTDKGLGQIAMNGPTKTSVLNPYGTVTFPNAAGGFIMEIACNPSKW